MLMWPINFARILTTAVRVRWRMRVVAVLSGALVLVAFGGCKRRASADIFDALQRKDRDSQEIRRIVESDPSVVNSKKYGTTPLHVAAGNGDAVTVRLLLKHGTQVDARDGYGTPLHSASHEGDLETVRVLLEAGADVNAPDADGDTPLHQAVEWNPEQDVIRLLLDSGANVDVKNKAGETATDIARRQWAVYAKPSENRTQSFDREQIQRYEAAEKLLQGRTGTSDGEARGAG